MSDKSDGPKTTRVFIGDSVPTSHLPEVIKKSAPTAHLPIQPGIGEPGATVPTSHLPASAPAPTPTPSSSGDKN